MSTDTVHWTPRIAQHNFYFDILHYISEYFSKDRHTVFLSAKVTWSTNKYKIRWLFSHKYVTQTLNYYWQYLAITFIWIVNPIILTITYLFNFSLFRRQKKKEECVGWSIDKTKNEYIHHCRTQHEFFLYMQKKRRKRKAFCPTGAKQIIKKCLHIARDIKQNELVYLNCCCCCCCWYCCWWWWWWWWSFRNCLASSFSRSFACFFVLYRWFWNQILT
jgi:hypothetical protein